MWHSYMVWVRAFQANLIDQTSLYLATLLDSKARKSWETHPVKHSTCWLMVPYMLICWFIVWVNTNQKSTNESWGICGEKLGTKHHVYIGFLVVWPQPFNVPHILVIEQSTPIAPVFWWECLPKEPWVRLEGWLIGYRGCTLVPLQDWNWKIQMRNPTN